MIIEPQRWTAFPPERLAGMRRGIEKESLRALPDGRLALTPHPAALGSALTHPVVTTDYSESQLELITGAHATVEGCLAELRSIHQFVVRCLAQTGDERLWVSSMPCRLPTDENIPLGQYGTSNVARAKSVYRMGLGHRYGRRMQTISGIHYNWSLPGLGNDDYFALIRNFRRRSFFLLLLLGASPALCASFVEGRVHELEPVAPQTLGLPFATSLRMGRLGYQSDAQAGLAVSYNGLEGYAASLHEALTRPYPAYERIGIRNPGGDYNQLSTTLLQIENEFYSTIRPKRTIQPGERPLHALRERGVEYVEVRLIDLDPFEPLGIAADSMHLLDVFLLACLLDDSPPDTPQEIAALGRNQQQVAARGRDPSLRLECGDRMVGALDWAAEIAESLMPVARRLDAALGSLAHEAAVAQAIRRLDATHELPSARVLAQLREGEGRSHVDWVCDQSRRVHDRLLALPWTVADDRRYESMRAQSLADQRAIEAGDTMPFEVYREAYLSPARLGRPAGSR